MRMRAKVVWIAGVTRLALVCGVLAFSAADAPGIARAGDSAGRWSGGSYRVPSGSMEPTLGIGDIVVFLGDRSPTVGQTAREGADSGLVVDVRRIVGVPHTRNTPLGTILTPHRFAIHGGLVVSVQPQCGLLCGGQYTVILIS
jgi:hypothetical protein